MPNQALEEQQAEKIGELRLCLRAQLPSVGPSASSPSRTEHRFSARWEGLAASKASALIKEGLKKEKTPGKRGGKVQWKFLHGPTLPLQLLLSLSPRDAGRGLEGPRSQQMLGLQKATFKLHLHHVSLFHVRLSLPSGPYSVSQS